MVVPTNKLPLAQSESFSTRFRIVRVLWAVLILLAFWFFFTGISLRYAILATPCSDTICMPLQLTVDRIQLLSSISMSLSAYAAYVLAIELVLAVGFIGAGVIIVWRRSNTPIGLFISLAFITFGSNVIINGTGQPSFREWSVLSLIVTMSSWLSFALVFYVFPDGQFVPPRIRFVGYGMALFAVSWLVLDLPRNPGTWFPAQAISVVLFLGGGVLNQVYRFRRLSTRVQQQQIKWVVIGMVGAVLGGGVISFLSFLVGGSVRSAALVIVIAPLASLFFLCLPVSFVIALLRYRLWDVDQVINRTLVYVPLTALLAGILAASQAILQKLTIVLTGSSSDFTTIITTLLLVSLFTPLQATLQKLVDKRFKVAPDPTKNLRELSFRIQNQIDVFDAPIICRLFLEETVKAFDATSGAIYIMHSDQFQLLHHVGAWHEDAFGLCVQLESDNLLLGQLCISHRENKTEYSDEEKEVLNKAIIPLAHAVRLMGKMLV
jgi:hypothetical protein